ncbi:MAG: 1,4-dihydroxy-2-naphthoate polyprenyltransferase [Candidatus Promineifilaceae bacterium]
MATMTKRQAWIAAMRPRTLPLALAGIGMGSFLAGSHGKFDGSITLLAILTATFLQILSNLANDYGDSIHGADSAERKGPSRAVQSGLITAAEMQRAMMICALLAMISGLVLIGVSLGAQQLLLAIIFVLIGGASVWAAINYTAGDNPYGYMGLGDLFVLLFFGLAGVLGSYYLQARELNGLVVLPAISMGVFAVAVLNINNIRDIDSDVKAGKNSIPVRLGGENARIYNWVLLGIGVVCALLYVALTFSSVWQFLFVLVLPLIFKIGRTVQTSPNDQLDPLLKQMVLASLLFMLTFGIGQLLA